MSTSIHGHYRVSRILSTRCNHPLGPGPSQFPYVQGRPPISIQNNPPWTLIQTPHNPLRLGAQHPVHPSHLHPRPQVLTSTRPRPPTSRRFRSKSSSRLTARYARCSGYSVMIARPPSSHNDHEGRPDRDTMLGTWGSNSNQLDVELVLRAGSEGDRRRE